MNAYATQGKQSHTVSVKLRRVVSVDSPVTVLSYFAGGEERLCTVYNLPSLVELFFAVGTVCSAVALYYI